MSCRGAGADLWPFTGGATGRRYGDQKSEKRKKEYKAFHAAFLSAVLAERALEERRAVVETPSGAIARCGQINATFVPMRCTPPLITLFVAGCQFPGSHFPQLNQSVQASRFVESRAAEAYDLRDRGHSREFLYVQLLEPGDL